jgi:hypothetical protein
VPPTAEVWAVFVGSGDDLTIMMVHVWKNRVVLVETEHVHAFYKVSEDENIAGRKTGVIRRAVPTYGRAAVPAPPLIVVVPVIPVVPG